MVFCLTTLMNELLLQIDTRPPYATQTVMQLPHLSDVVVCARAPVTFYSCCGDIMCVLNTKGKKQAPVMSCFKVGVTFR